MQIVINRGSENEYPISSETLNSFICFKKSTIMNPVMEPGALDVEKGVPSQYEQEQEAIVRKVFVRISCLLK